MLVLALGSAAAIGGLRLRRLRRRRQLEVDWHQRDVEWEAALQKVKAKRPAASSRAGSRRLRQVDFS
ncbi:MAG TPA: hypothetical protein VFI17_08570 [Solirubrobacterales bacterium]|nr:hypothetical protein [Solirubrobacterales bacterium]